MRILNGDHAAFEIEHQNTPKELRPDWPMPSFDGRDWAKAFCKIAQSKGHDIDEGWMNTWFSCALMRGFDEAMDRTIAAPAPVAPRWRRIVRGVVDWWRGESR